MDIYRFNNNGIQKSEKLNFCKNVILLYRSVYDIFLKCVFLLFIGIILESCATYHNTNTANNGNSDEFTISEISNNQTSLNKSDVSKYFCTNMTEYFNTYKYYKISTEVYNEKEKQSNISTTKITKQGRIYTLVYIGAAGVYSILFSNKEFPEAEEIHTFGRLTILGNAIRGKVYDTFTAWLQRQEIALKANYNTYLFKEELDAAIEVEKWYNSLSTNND